MKCGVGLPTKASVSPPGILAAPFPRRLAIATSLAGREQQITNVVRLYKHAAENMFKGATKNMKRGPTNGSVGMPLNKDNQAVHAYNKRG